MLATRATIGTLGLVLGAVFSVGCSDGEQEAVQARRQAVTISETALANPSSGGGYGQAVAMTPQVVFVGAPDDSTLASKAGAVWIWRMNVSFNWVSTKLTASDGAANAAFGRSVAVSGTALADTTLAVGSAGAVYVYVYSSGNWVLQQKLTPAAPDPQFGEQVAIDGDRLVVAHNDCSLGTSLGSTVYQRSATGVWTVVGTVDTRLSVRSLALSGTTVALGSAACGSMGCTSAAAVSVYTPSGKTGFTKTSIGTSTCGFGAAVDLDGTRLAVLSSVANNVQIFVKSGSWNPEATLTPPSGAFKGGLSLNGDTLLIGATADATKGANAGAVHLYIRGGNGWQHRGTYRASDGASGDLLGSAVATLREVAVVGAPGGTGKAYRIAFNLLESGQSCTVADGCYSNVCVAGVCCASACTDLCQTCQTGICENTPLGVQDTSTPSTCTGNNACDGAGQCKKNSGQACTLANDCLSNLCVDSGVCCATTCSGLCQSCASGSCENTPVGTEDLVAPICSGTHECDGNGGCKKKVSQTCSANAECASNLCVEGFCCASACTGLCQSCETGQCVNTPAGTEDLQQPSTCSGDSACDGKGNCGKKGGKTCNSGADCTGGHCVDGYCCDSACDKTCEACNIAGSEGSCTKIPVNTDPDGECLGPDAVCGGACDGLGQCAFPGIGTACGTCKACDGTGTCAKMPPDDSTCGEIDCDELDNGCMDFHALKSERCASFGKCKPANDPASCSKYTPLQCDGGGPSPSDGGIKQDSGTTPPKASSGGCQVAEGAGDGSPLPVLFGLLFLLLAGRRPRRLPQLD